MTKFLTYEDRLEIAASLKDNCSFGEIGKKLVKDRTTIAKEIKKHSYERKSGYSGWPYNACRHRTSCKASKLCGQDCPRKSIQYCKFCNQCNDFCPQFVEKICIARFKPPYVCNGCVRNGQSIHQIYESNIDLIMCSEKTLYNYIDASLFDVRNIDLPRKVRYRLRYKKPEFKIDKGCRIGRSYRDFLAFMEKNPDLPVVQMDTVIGSKGGKVL